MKRILLMALLGTAACGELSNDDLVFLRGVPSKQELRLDVAASGTEGALMADVGQDAEFYADAYAISEETNASVASILDFVDSIGDDTPPTTRERDRRVWGPFADGQGRTIRFEVRREGTSFRYCLHVGSTDQVTGEPTCDDIPGAFGMNAILYGTYTPRFAGAGVAQSNGEVTFDFEAAIRRPFGDERGKLVITHAYSDDGAAKDITLSAERPQLGLEPAVNVDYSYARDVDGRVLFALALPAQFFGTPIRENLAIDACWREGGAGRADVVISGGDLTGRNPALAVECWGATHKRTYASYTSPDYPNFDLSEGDITACPPVSCD